MKKPSSELFYLVQKMSKAEKKYFRQHAQRHTIGSKNNYLELFDTLLKLKTYDEKALKLKLQDSSYSRYFAVAKQYLYQQILDSLASFHAQKSVHEQIKKELHLAKILQEKKLVEQGKKQVQKALKRIEKNQLWQYLPEAVILGRNLGLFKEKDSFTGLFNSFQYLEKTLKLLHQYNVNWYHTQVVFQTHYAKVNLSKKEERTTLDKSIQKLKEQGIPPNTQWQIDYFRALATYYFMLGNHQEAAKHNQTLLQLFEDNPPLIDSNKEQYIVTVNNALIDNNILKNYEVLEQGIQKLRTLAQLKKFNTIPNLPTKVFCLTYSLQFNAFISQQKFKTAYQLIPNLQKGLDTLESKIPSHYGISFSYIMAYTSFMNNDWDHALTYLDRMQERLDKHVLQEFLWAGKRLYVLTHWELGNYLLLDNLLDNLRRSRNRQQKKSELDDVLFKYLKQLLKEVDETAKQGIYQQLLLELQQLKASNPTTWNYFDFEYWLSRKLARV